MGLSPQQDRELRERFKDITVFQTLGFEFLVLEDGRARVRVPRMDDFNGVYTTFHGGLLTTVADCVAWVALITRLGADAHLTTTDIHIRFLAPCFSDVTAEARVIKLGRTLCPVNVDLFDAQGLQVAVAQVTYFQLGGAPADAGKGD